MLDRVCRRALDAPLGRMAAVLDRPGITPDRITVFGLVAGLAGALFAGLASWPFALTLWLLSRLADGLDGPLARRRSEQAGNATSTDAGGFLDRRAQRQADRRRPVAVLLGGLAEGTETIVVHALWCLLPWWAEQIAWTWAAIVAISATQRIAGGYRALRSPAPVRP